jgi:hypothetical protein
MVAVVVEIQVMAMVPRFPHQYQTGVLDYLVIFQVTTSFMVLAVRGVV